MNNPMFTNTQRDDKTQFFSPEIPNYLPAHKMYKIQIGGELFLLSGASISSDGPHSYFLDFFQNIENEQENRQKKSDDQNENIMLNPFDSRMVNVDVQERVLFIDRDPEIFRFIYNHLQGYYITIPNEIIYTKLFSDAMYYRLPRLRGLLKNSGFYYANIGGQSFKIEKQLFKHEGNDKNYFKITAEMIYQDIESFFMNQGKRRILRPPPQTWSHCTRSPELFKQILILLNGGKFDGSAVERHNLLKEVRFYRLLKLEQELLAHKFFNNPFNHTPEIFLNLLDIKADSNHISLTDLELESPHKAGPTATNGSKFKEQNSELANSKYHSNESNSNSTQAKKRKLNPACQLEKITVDDIMNNSSKGTLCLNKNSDEIAVENNKTSEIEETASKNIKSDSYALNEDSEFHPPFITWKVFSYKRPFVDAWEYPMLFQIGNASHPDEKTRAVDHCFVNTAKTIDNDGKILQTKPQQSTFFADPDCTVDYGTLLFDPSNYCCFISFEGLIARKIFKLLKLVLPETFIRNTFIHGYTDKEEKIVQRIILPSCVKFAVFILDNKVVKNFCGLLKQSSFLNMLSTERFHCKIAGNTNKYYKIPLCDRSVWRMAFKKGEKSDNDKKEIMMIATKIRCGSIKEYNNYF